MLCDTNSLILHPFNTIRTKNVGSYSVSIMICPECGLKKMYTMDHAIMESGRFVRSRVLDSGMTSKILADRYMKLFQWRRN